MKRCPLPPGADAGTRRPHTLMKRTDENDAPGDAHAHRAPRASVKSESERRAAHARCDTRSVCRRVAPSVSSSRVQRAKNVSSTMASASNNMYAALQDEGETAVADQEAPDVLDSVLFLQ